MKKYKEFCSAQRVPRSASRAVERFIHLKMLVMMLWIAFAPLLVAGQIATNAPRIMWDNETDLNVSLNPAYDFDWIYSTVQTANGNYLSAGYAGVSGTSQDNVPAWALHSPNGRLIYHKEYGFYPGTFSEALEGDDGYFLVGNVKDGSEFLFVVKINKTDLSLNRSLSNPFLRQIGCDFLISDGLIQCHYLSKQ